jgi:uncharacterized alkaline shock family protein YloU
MEADTIIYKISSEELQRAIEGVAKKEVDVFLAKFNEVFVGPEDIARFHGVSKQTVYNHVKYGTLIPEFREKTGGTIRFRLNEALKIDFKKLGKKLV